MMSMSATTRNGGQCDGERWWLCAVASKNGGGGCCKEDEDGGSANQPEWAYDLAWQHCIVAMNCLWGWASRSLLATDLGSQNNNFPNPPPPSHSRRELGARRTASYTPAANSELVALPHTVATVLGSSTAIPSETHASLMNATCIDERPFIWSILIEYLEIY
ncbi:hypothetical protein TIFTF001_030594 [Ficus carica]|uniref:Uncharacterized protein n=1 Tax=Ficus carica TaxID=3494 RepID=A0AA88DXT6_FICCA|nr:hypothetical protein TIFTF001_030594 [Ficus carica]